MALAAGACSFVPKPSGMEALDQALMAIWNPWRHRGRVQRGLTGLGRATEFRDNLADFVA